MGSADDLPDRVLQLIDEHGEHAVASVHPTGVCTAYAQATLLVWRFWEGADASAVRHQLPYSSQPPYFLQLVVCSEVGAALSELLLLFS